MRALYMCRFIILMNARSLVTSGKRKAKKLEKPATLPALSIFTHLSFSSHCCATSQSKIEGYDFISISRLHHLNQEKGLLISIHLLHRCCNFTFFISLLLLRILANSVRRKNANNEHHLSNSSPSRIHHLYPSLP